MLLAAVLLGPIAVAPSLAQDYQPVPPCELSRDGVMLGRDPGEDVAAGSDTSIHAFQRPAKVEVTDLTLRNNPHVTPHSTGQWLSALPLPLGGRRVGGPLFQVAATLSTAAVAAAEGADAAPTRAEDQSPTFGLARLAAQPTRRPMVLSALYASQIALQVLDAHSTYSAIDRGGVEVNPLMKNVVGNKGTMLAVKAGVAASVIVLAERMWKRGSRTGAVVVMLIANGVTAAVVASNYKVASSLR
jgi:hypothetical protein